MASIQFKKNKTGKKTYYVVVSYNSKHKWLKAGALSDAKKLKKQIESLEKSQQMEKLGLTNSTIRIDEFFQKYADNVKLHNSPNTVKRYLSVLNTFLVFLKMFHPGIKHLSQLKTEHIESYQKQRLQSIELKIEADGEKNGNHNNKRLPLPQTVNYEIGVLRSAFIWAYDREHIAFVPTKKVKKLKPKPTNKTKILTPKECKLLLKTAKSLAKTDKRMKVYFNAFQFILNTGLRSGELCNLMWNNVDFETGLIKIQEKPGWSPKTYAREFYLNETSQKLLKSLPDREGYIFKDISGNKLDNDHLRSALIKIAKATGLNDFTRVHNLRHTFNSLMQMNGVDIATMGKILGHKDIETTMIYTHQTGDHLKKCINQISI
ncbi:MAG: site-specific integrase [candidate division Zixibacteria bacterium]|nr:site-specific integrase [candidate division Zixibacteria bacterium]